MFFLKESFLLLKLSMCINVNIDIGSHTGGAAPAGENPLAFLRDHEMFQQIRRASLVIGIKAELLDGFGSPYMTVSRQGGDPAEPKHALDYAAANRPE